MRIVIPIDMGFDLRKIDIDKINIMNDDNEINIYKYGYYTHSIRIKILCALYTIL